MRNVPRARAASTSDARLRGVHGERLLDQHRLAGLDREHRGVVVHRVRRRDVDGVDERVGDEVGVRRVRARDAEPARERVGRAGAARADGDDLVVGQQLQVVAELASRCRRRR